MTRQSDPFAHAEHTASTWLAAVAHELGTNDEHYTYRVLRAWLHTVRDRLPVDSTAHLAAQLPALLRGIYYEGWTPSRVPMRFDASEFTERFAHAAGLSASDVNAAATAVTRALDGLFSAGQLDHVLSQLPQSVLAELTNGEQARQSNQQSPTGRLDRLERAVEVLTEAVTELAHGLETSPLDEPDGKRDAKAARAVHQLLLTKSSG